MRDALAELLRCPGCGGERCMALRARHRDAREVREGELACEGCSQRFGIAAGIVDLLVAPPEFVLRERAGLERFADVMRADGWDEERIRALPDIELPYWQGQRRALDELLARVEMHAGETLLDVGSNTCWASRIFASMGLDVIALDIADCELQGLRTAECFIASGEVFFERVLSTMFAPALAGESVDYVFCCEVLHHNDRAHLRRTFRELHRVLRPGGRLFVVNEPLRFPLRPKLDHGREVREFEGNEHVYFLAEYWGAARRAGFSVQIPGLAGASRRGRLRWAWRQLLRGDVPLTMDCTKG
jgi:SAM-dependent methyltransferase